MSEKNASSLKLFAAVTVSGILHISMLALPVFPVSGPGLPYQSISTRLAVRLIEPRKISPVEDSPQEDNHPLTGPAIEPRESFPELGQPGPAGLIESPMSSPYLGTSEVDIRATPIDPPPLTLPEVVLQRHIHGKVVLKVFISATGRVDAAEVISSSHPGLLEEAARDVVQATHFSPAYRGGLAVKSSKRIEVIFDPDEPAGQ